MSEQSDYIRQSRLWHKQLAIMIKDDLRFAKCRLEEAADSQRIAELAIASARVGERRLKRSQAAFAGWMKKYREARARAGKT